jgi:hypothetical protein
MFVEVNSVEKGCPVIVNMDHIVEIAPLREGGCALFMSDGAGMNSKTALKVTDSYDQFKQFAITPVSADDIARRFPKEKPKVEDELEIPTLGIKSKK